MKLKVLLHGPHMPLAFMARTCQQYRVSGVSSPASPSAYCGLTDEAFIVYPDFTFGASIVRELSL